MFKLYTHREKGEPLQPPLTNQEQQLITSNRKHCDFYWFLLRTARIFGSPVHGWNYLALFPLQNPGLHILREHNPEITNLDFAGLVSCATGGPNKINVFKRGLPSEGQQPSFWVPCHLVKVYAADHHDKYWTGSDWARLTGYNIALLIIVNQTKPVMHMYQQVCMCIIYTHNKQFGL